MGVTHWIFQRISNVAIVVFGLWLVYFLASPGEVDFKTLKALFNDTTSIIYLLATLILAGLNSILAGWQIAGDYAEKFGINETLMVAFGTIVSIGYIAAGLCIAL